MNAAIPPPPFLQFPGVPRFSWRQWRPVMQAYIDAAAMDATPEHKKALLLNTFFVDALGVDNINCYLPTVDEEQQPGADRETPINPHQDPAWRPARRPRQAMSNMAAFLPEVRGKMAPASFLLGGPVAYSPATSSARVGARFRCGSSQHWANSRACPAWSSTCARCGKRGHFVKVCRSSRDQPASPSP
ncbi:hypothetical protein HPB50_007983 [Hyalomma asiaticum]|uniref:Uncharacterized protein n=1 Tax=Hyalomma asiaticum TaxID=266040 RepID=A0ACB7RUW3_HYAAI|nr:hypothetical protein HPB50_007983 [Hyalomma asiaticum]